MCIKENDRTEIMRNKKRSMTIKQYTFYEGIRLSRRDAELHLV